jgi:hypothetical protein
VAAQNLPEDLLVHYIEHQLGRNVRTGPGRFIRTFQVSSQQDIVRLQHLILVQWVTNTNRVFEHSINFRHDFLLPQTRWNLEDTHRRIADFGDHIVDIFIHAIASSLEKAGSKTINPEEIERYANSPEVVHGRRLDGSVFMVPMPLSTLSPPQQPTPEGVRVIRIMKR